MKRRVNLTRARGIPDLQAHPVWRKSRAQKPKQTITQREERAGQAEGEMMNSTGTKIMREAGPTKRITKGKRKSDTDMGITLTKIATEGGKSTMRSKGGRKEKRGRDMAESIGRQRREKRRAQKRNERKKEQEMVKIDMTERRREERNTEKRKII